MWLDIDNANLNTTQFSFKIKGTVDNNNGTEKYEMSAAVENYQNLVHTSSEYINRILKSAHQNLLSNALGISGNIFDVSKDMQESIIKFIRKSSDAPSSSSPNIKITVKKKPQDEYPSTNSLSAAEFKIAWLAFVSDIFLGKAKQGIVGTIEKQVIGKLGGGIAGPVVNELLSKLPIFN